MKVAGIEVLPMLHGATVAANEDDIDEIIIHLKEKDRHGFEKQVSIRVRRNSDNQNQIILEG